MRFSGRTKSVRDGSSASWTRNRRELPRYSVIFASWPLKCWDALRVRPWMMTRSLYRNWNLIERSGLIGYLVTGGLGGILACLSPPLFLSFLLFLDFLPFVFLL